MISDPDPELGGAMQLMGTIKTLVDPENMVKSVSCPYFIASSITFHCFYVVF